MTSWLGEQFKGMDFKSFSFGMVLSTGILVGVFGAQHVLLKNKVGEVQADVDKFYEYVVPRVEFQALKEQVNRMEDKLDRLLER